MRKQIKSFLGKIINWWSKDVEEEEEEKELDKILSRFQRRQMKILQNGLELEGQSAAATLNTIENAHIQRKMTEATDGLKNATWLLALATIAFTWAAIADSPNSSTILSQMSGVLIIVAYILMIGAILAILGRIIKFVYNKL